MNENEVHLDDIGTIFRATIKEINGGVATAIDISNATTKQLIFTKPGGTKVTQTAAFTNAGIDGKMQYTVVSGDIDELGWWTVQGYVKTPVGEWHTNTQQFKVYSNL